MKGRTELYVWKRLLWGFIALAVLALLPAGIRLSYGSIEEQDDWTKEYTLIVTEAQDIDEAYAAQDAIEKEGGHVALIIPDRVMLGWVPPGAFKSLLGKSKIVGLYNERISAAERKALQEMLSDEEMEGIRFFNRARSGQFKPQRLESAQPSQDFPSGPIMLPDALVPPPIHLDSYMENLKGQGINEKRLAANGISVIQTAEGASPSPGNSDYMVGKVVFNVIFVESNGNIDTNEFTWTKADKTIVQDEIKAGLSWWSKTAQKSSAYNTPLTFICKFSTKYQGYEPIRHPSSDDYLWIEPIMANMGYSSGNRFDRTVAFNTAQRVANNANWSVVSFVGYNPSPAPSTFTDGYFAYCYIRGPYSQLLFRNDGWGTGNYDVVNAHETGHLFGAVDEYHQAGYGGCTSCDRTTNQVYNGNCAYCNTNSVPCIMKNNSMALCGYTPGQLGWGNATDMSVTTCRVDNGSSKNFFAPGETIKYKTTFCIAGPQMGSQTHPVRVRFRADYFNNYLDGSTTISDDTGWGTAGSITPPTGTGKSCWFTEWNRTVPLDITYGHATLGVQLEIGGMGRQAKSQSAKFFVAKGAETTEPSAVKVLFGPGDRMVDEGPFIEPILPQDQ